MADTPRWVTAQFRIRGETHDYLAGQAREAGISITQAAGVILDYAAREGWEIGRVIVTRQPAIVTRLDDGQQHDTTRS